MKRTVEGSPRKKRQEKGPKTQTRRGHQNTSNLQL